MVNNKRGEVITLTVIGLCVLVGVLGAFIGGSKYGKLVGIGGNDQKIIRTVKSEPIILKGADGKDYWVQKTEESTTNADVPMTLIQRVMMLPKILILLVILGCVFPPFGVILVALYSRVRGGLGQLVNGLEQAKKVLPPDSVTTLETNLSKKMDTSLKSLVKEIKVKL
jgi:hypothetical protein